MRKLFMGAAIAAMVAGSSVAQAAPIADVRSNSPVAEAEVTTKLPENQVSDQQLQAAAEGAAAVAETPQAAASVVVSPTPTGPATGSGGQPSGAATTPH